MIVIIKWTVSCLLLLTSCQDRRAPIVEITPERRVGRTGIYMNENSTLDFLNGFYLNTWNNSGALVIDKGEISHFNLVSSNSFLKDEQYGFSRLEDDRIVINKRYRLNRKDEVEMKETLLKDIQVVLENGVCVALERNSRRFIKIDNLEILMNQLGLDIDRSLTEATGLDKIDDIVKQRLLNKNQFSKEGGLGEQTLYGNEYSTSEMIRRLYQTIL